MSGRLIGLHSYKINEQQKTVKTSQLVAGCVSNLVYFNSKKIAFFTKDNGFVYKYVHTGKLSKFANYFQTISNFSLGNSLVKDPHEELLFVVTGKNKVSVFGDISDGGKVSCFEVQHIDGMVTQIIPGSKKGIFFVITQTCKILTYQITHDPGNPEVLPTASLTSTFELDGLPTSASLCPKHKFLTLALANLQGRLTKLLILEVFEQSNLEFYSYLDF